MTPVPVFLFSLPRSGSTFTQRVLAAHDGVFTRAEPWVLLPLLAPLRQEMALADVWQDTVNAAIADFNGLLPAGRTDYEEAARRFAMDLYDRASTPETRFFIDKTPPYHHIADEIIRILPDARFVFLWRNPLAVLSSVVETLCDGRWGVYDYRGDLFHGVANLTGAFSRHRDRVHAVRYEDLVRAEQPWRDLCDYIGLPFQPTALSSFRTVRLEGRMGDPTGVHLYGGVSTEPLDKWRATIANPVRIAWARRWLRWIGRERLALMGYDLDQLLDDLRQVASSSDHVTADLRDLAAAAARESVRANTGNGNRLASTWRHLLAAPPD